MPDLPPMPESGHVYVFVRRDLPLADQMVQVAHVCLEAGQAFCVPRHCPLVLLEVADEPALRRVLEHCRRCAISAHIYGTGCGRQCSVSAHGPDSRLYATLEHAAATAFTSLPPVEQHTLSSFSPVGVRGLQRFV